MEFESPDVEKDFPGLYASESGKRSQESDFSDDAHDKPSKKDLLIGKRKDKKESKKDLGYAALEGESSPEEDLDMKSPSKSKKSKSFKFPTIKEKREKSREKDVREKDREKEREAEKEKEKKKEKGKLKLKERKKSKHGDEELEIGDALPVFGVPLAVAVERSHCHDGVALPLVMRNCIDHVQDCGLLVEGVYKLSGIKSKVQQLKRSYNQREAVRLSDYDLPTTVSLLKTFLRDLPEPLVTSELLPRFEDVAGIKELAARELELEALVSNLPPVNRTALSWLFLHLETVAHEGQNKMGMNALAANFGPVLQMSQRLVIALLTHCRALFPNVRLTRYVPPISAGTSSLPESPTDITGELEKQESLLSQIHREMNLGYTTSQRTDQLWEVQRIVTQLKRKLKSLERAQESSHVPAEDTSQVPPSTENAVAAQLTPATAASSDGTGNSGGSNGSEAEETLVQDDAEVGGEDARNSGSSCGSVTLPVDPVRASVDMTGLSAFMATSDEAVARLMQQELQKLQADLLERIRQERATVEKLRAEIVNLSRHSSRNNKYGDLDSENSSEEVDTELNKHNEYVQQKRTLLRKIVEEREACLQLRVKCSMSKGDVKADGNESRVIYKPKNNITAGTPT